MGTPHDHLFRHVFGEPAHAAALLRRILPSAIVAATDWTTLHECSGLLVDPLLDRQELDLLFAARRLDRDGMIFLQVEHLSQQHRFAVLRLRGYSQRLWEKWRAANADAKALPLIVPVVVHHGDQPWRMPLRLDELREAAPAGITDDFAILLADLAMYSETHLSAWELPAPPRLALLYLQCARWLAPDALEGAFERWQGLLREVAAPPGGPAALQVFHSYILRVTEMTAGRLAAVVNRLVGPGAGAIVMSTAEKLIAEGMARGLAKGRAEGKAEQLLRLLRRRFGSDVDAVTARVQSAAPDDLDRWADRLLDARTLADLFGPG